MARYIDADKLKEALSHYGIEDVIFRDEIEMYIDDTPTAGCAPKSEADKWYHEYHAIKDELRREKIEHSATERLADRYFIELKTAKSEIAKTALLEFKKLVHDKAVYTNSQDIPNYINLKVFDAILQNYLNGLK